MVIEIEIELGDSRGVVQYSENLRKIDVDFPIVPIQAAVREYLQKEREFWIPESHRTDDFRVDRAHPYDSTTYFELAMCSLWSATGVLVDWPTEKRREE